MSAPFPASDDDRTIGRGDTTLAPVVIGNALAPGTRVSEFEITKVIGEGGFGIVYLAWDHSLQRQVAIKEYMPASLAARTRLLAVSVRSERYAETFAVGLKSFVNEARLLAQFDHPSLVKVYRFWEANGTAYMVMPHYAGTTLRETLGALGRPADEAFLMRLLDPLLDTLAEIHRVQCYHRDIAPDNILMLDGGRPLLLDFGAARRVIGDMTSTLTAILKPGYAPVEQYGDVPELRQGAWTDLYALGSVVYFAIVGRTPQQALPRFLKDQQEPLARTHAGQYSDRFLSAIDAALRVHPRDRPQSVEEMRALLGITGAAPGSNAPRPASTERASGPRSASLVIGVASVLVLAAGGVYLLDRAAPPVAAGDAAPVLAAPLPAQPAPPPEAARPVQPAPAAAAAPPVQGAPAPEAFPAAAPAPAPPAHVAPEHTAPAPAPAPHVPPVASEEPAAVASPQVPEARPAASTAPPVALERDGPAAVTPKENVPPRRQRPAGTAPAARTAAPSTPPPAAPPTGRSTTAAAADPPVHKADDAKERCRGIIQRASLGEPLEPDERTFLKQECGR